MDSVYSVSIDGNKAFTGDDVSIRVIFNNLNGRNFLKSENSWQRLGTHSDYLNAVKEMCGAEVLTGSLIQMTDETTGRVVCWHRYEEDMPGSYHTEDGLLVEMEGVI